MIARALLASLGFYWIRYAPNHRQLLRDHAAVISPPAQRGGIVRSSEGANSACGRGAPQLPTKRRHANAERGPRPRFSFSPHPCGCRRENIGDHSQNKKRQPGEPLPALVSNHVACVSPDNPALLFLRPSRCADCDCAAARTVGHSVSYVRELSQLRRQFINHQGADGASCLPPLLPSPLAPYYARAGVLESRRDAAHHSSQSHAFNQQEASLSPPGACSLWSLCCCVGVGGRSSRVTSDAQIGRVAASMGCLFIQRDKSDPASKDSSASVGSTPRL